MIQTGKNTRFTKWFRKEIPTSITHSKRVCVFKGHFPSLTGVSRALAVNKITIIRGKLCVAMFCDRMPFLRPTSFSRLLRQAGGTVCLFLCPGHRAMRIMWKSYHTMPQRMLYNSIYIYHRFTILLLFIFILGRQVQVVAARVFTAAVRVYVIKFVITWCPCVLITKHNNNLHEVTQQSALQPPLK